jgi:protein TonB
VRVVNAKPRRIFDAAAMAAARRWRFKPRVVNGQAVAQRGLQRIEFKLSD